MAFDFAALKKKAASLVETGMDKAKEMSEIGKLKMQNAEEQTNIRKAYMELGKLYYAQHADAPEEAYAAFCQQITDAKAKIAYNNERIEDMKAAGNISDEELPADEDIPDAEPVDPVEPAAPEAPVDIPEDNAPEL